MVPVRCACGASLPVCQSGSHGYVLKFASGTQIQDMNGTSDAVCMWRCIGESVCVCVCMCVCVREGVCTGVC